MPQPFHNAVITNGGARLLNRAQAGETNIEFTRVVTGNGVYGDGEKEAHALQGAKALKSQKNSYPISNKGVFSEHSVKLEALITNFDPAAGEALIDEGYYINEIGLYAKPSGGGEESELLYSIAVTAGEAGDFMPPYNGFHPTEIVQEYYATVSNSAEVTIQRGMGALALADDLQDTNLRVDCLEKRGSWFCVCGSRKADVEKKADAEGFQLSDGVRAVVYFTWGNTAENITLDINGTGAHPVLYKNAPIPADFIQAEWAVELAYHAGSWRVVGDLAQAQADRLGERIGALRLNGMEIDGAGGRANYGVCSALGSEVTKTVACGGFHLSAGAEVTVRFTNAHTAQSLKLNVNGTGTKDAYYRWSAITPGYIKAGGTYTFQYTGSRFEAVGGMAEFEADKMKTALDALKERVGFLELLTGIQSDLSAGVVEKMNVSQTPGKLWVPTDSGMGYIYQQSTGRGNEKCAVVNVESGRAYTVVTYVKEEDKDSVFVALEANGAGAMNSYQKAGSVFSGKGGKLIFKASPSSQFLLVNSCGSSADIEVYKSTK